VSFFCCLICRIPIIFPSWLPNALPCLQPKGYKEGQVLFGTFRKIRFLVAPCNKAFPLILSLYYLLPLLELLVSFQNFEDDWLTVDCLVTLARIHTVVNFVTVMKAYILRNVKISSLFLVFQQITLLREASAQTSKLTHARTSARTHTHIHTHPHPHPHTHTSKSTNKKKTNKHWAPLSSYISCCCSA